MTTFDAIKALTPDSYTVYEAGSQEPVTELIQPGAAWIVTCHYGSDVLVMRPPSGVDGTLGVIDIDGALPGDPLTALRDRLAAVVKALSVLLTTGDTDLARRDLLSRVHEWSFRVYETAAGYRLLRVDEATELNGICGELFASVSLGMGGDQRYIDLTAQQKCFRARLTPKRWRAHLGDGREALTCRYLGNIGPADTVLNLRPLRQLVELHDERTGALDGRWNDPNNAMVYLA